MQIKTAFVTSHPIQYQAPVFRELSKDANIDLTVLFCQIPNAKSQGTGFNVPFSWDIPLLDGYKYRVLKNVSKSPSVTSFSGCDTPEVFSVLKKEQFDAVVVNGWVVKSCLQTLFAAKRLGIPCIVRGEANNLRERAWWKKILQRQLVRSYSAYLYIGEANRRFYTNYGIRPEKLFFSPYCIDNKRFSQFSGWDDAQDEARKKFGIDEGTCFLFCGKFERKKHPTELIRAWQRAWDNGARGTLLMVGDGELRVEAERLIQSHNARVLVVGFLNQSEIGLAYQASDCLVLPSDAGETWGLVVNEAMAAARPAIVSDLVGCREDLILAQETGDSFPFGNWERLSELLVHYSQQRSQLQVMGNRAKVHLEAYTPQMAANGITKAVSSNCRKTRKSDRPKSA